MTQEQSIRAARVPTALKVKQARIEAGLGQEQLSDLTAKQRDPDDHRKYLPRIAQANISNIERGKNAPNGRTVDRLMAAITDYLGHPPVCVAALEGTLGIVGRTEGKLVPIDPMGAPRPQEWLAEGFLARRYVTMIAGQEGAGKSTVTQTLALALARGDTDSMGMTLPGKPQRGLVIDAENIMVVDEVVEGSLAQERLQRFGLTDEVAPCLTVVGAGGFDLDKDFDALNASVAEMKATGGLDFVVLDSFMSLCFLSESSTSGMQRVLTKLNRLAMQHNVGVLLIHHTNKGGSAYRGSSAIGATIAAVWTFTRIEQKDPETGKKETHPTLRHLAPYKVRIAAEPRATMITVTGRGTVKAGEVPTEWDDEAAFDDTTQEG